MKRWIGARCSGGWRFTPTTRAWSTWAPPAGSPPTRRCRQPPAASSTPSPGSGRASSRSGWRCSCPMPSTRRPPAWSSRPLPGRAASTAGCRWPVPGPCPEAARWRLPTRARAPTSSTTPRIPVWRWTGPAPGATPRLWGSPRIMRPRRWSRCRTPIPATTRRPAGATTPLLRRCSRWTFSSGRFRKADRSRRTTRASCWPRSPTAAARRCARWSGQHRPCSTPPWWRRPTSPRPVHAISTTTPPRPRCCSPACWPTRPR